jgi:uncharacterized OB-fold protein
MCAAGKPAYPKPIPEITAAMRPFFDAAREHRLVVLRCCSCGTLRFPARELCNSCLSREVEWVPVCGRGTIFSYSVMHQVYHPGFANEVPYAVAVVELAEGVRMTTNIVDCPLTDLRIGMPVEVVFEEITSEVTLPKFRRVR